MTNGSQWGFWWDYFDDAHEEWVSWTSGRFYPLLFYKVSGATALLFRKGWRASPSRCRLVRWNTTATGK